MRVKCHNKINLILNFRNNLQDFYMPRKEKCMIIESVKNCKVKQQQKSGATVAFERISRTEVYFIMYTTFYIRSRSRRFRGKNV